MEGHKHICLLHPYRMISSSFKKCLEAFPLERYPVHTALARGDLDLLRKRLESCRINRKDAFKRTPLHFAMESMKDPVLRYEACRMLLDNGANINVRDNRKRTPLHYLSDRRIGGEVEDNGKLLDLLISRGARVNCGAGESLRSSPLFTAVLSDNFMAARKLLQSGADLSAGSDCRSLLAIAVSNENKDMFKLLLKYKAEVNDFEAIREASSFGRTEFLELIVDYSDELNGRNIIFKPGQSSSGALCHLLHDAVSQNNSDALELLLENGIDMSSYAVPSEDITCLLSHVYSRYQRYEHSIHVSRYENVFLKVLKHIVILMETDGSNIDRETSNFIQSNEFIQEKLRRYTKQVKVMKSTFLNEDFNFTYFDLFTKRGTSFRNCCSEEIVSAISEDNIEGLFPDFTEKLMRRIRKGVSQQFAVDNYKQMLYSTMSSKLSFDMICYICDFIEMKDLLNFRLHETNVRKNCKYEV